MSRDVAPAAAFCGQEGIGFPAALDCLRLVHADGPSAFVADVENNNRVTFDGECGKRGSRP